MPQPFRACLSLSGHASVPPEGRGDWGIYPPTLINHCLGVDFREEPGSSDGKESAYSAGDLGSIPGLGRSPGEENGHPLQYSCLENPTAATVHGIAKSQT